MRWDHAKLRPVRVAVGYGQIPQHRQGIERIEVNIKAVPNNELVTSLIIILPVIYGIVLVNFQAGEHLVALTYLEPQLPAKMNYTPKGSS